jgi:hypothetical protein
MNSICYDPTVELARCFLSLANLPNFALDRLSRHEATRRRQVGQILFALDVLDRRKPQDRHLHCQASESKHSVYGAADQNPKIPGDATS